MTSSNFLRMSQALTKKSILYNSEQTLIPSRYSFYMLRIQTLSGASTAKGRTGSREFFLASDGCNPHKPASSETSLAGRKADIRLCTSSLFIVT